jgi:photosystem II stability/assembly factor-like uncharacterized protein
MRTLACFALTAALLVAGGCGTVASDPCKGVAGTCVALTVQSSTVTAVDSLHILASGALTGDQTSSGGRANLPIVVALKLPSGVSGELDLHVDGVLTAAIVGSCDTSATVTDGQHTTLVCTLVGPDNGSIDMSMGGGDDLTGTGPDMLTPTCDPKGVTGPKCQWRWQTPLPVGEDIIGVHMFADNDTIALTSSGTLLHRDNTGWSVLPARPKPAIGTFNARRLAGGGSSITDLYIVGYNTPPGGGSTIDEVFHSADKGGSWTEEMLPNTATTGNNTFFGIVVGANGDVLLAGGFSHIVTRNHSNGTWTDFQTDATCAPPSMGCSTNYNTMTSSVLANVATYGNSISRANVGTNSWTLKITGPAGSNSIQLCNGWDGGSNIRYWGVGYGGVIITSTDSTTWALETSNTGAVLQGCTAIDNNRIWAFGASGAIVATTNGGVAGTGTWVGQTSGTSNQLLAGSNSPGTALTIVGQAGTILRTMNGGTSYTNEQTGPSGGWEAMFGLSPTNVWASGGGGSIVHTTDGLTWKAIATTGTATANLIGLWASSATNIYAVGTGGTLVHSTDGTSFTKYTNPASGGIPASATLYDITGLGANNVFVAADTGLYRSTDNGASFAPVTVTGFTGPAVTAIFAMNGSLWIGGANGQIYTTTDGVNFTAQTLTGVGASLHITRIRGRAPSELYAASTDGGWLAHTTNGGMTWTNGLVTSLGGSGAYDLAITPSGTVYATGAAGNGLAVSQDNGMNFVPVDTAPVPSEHIALYAPSDSEIFATDSGGIVHFGN